MSIPTRKQREVLSEITNYTRKHGYPPTVRELAQLVDVKSTATVQAHLDRLERLGFLRRVRGKSRTLTPVNEGVEL